MKTTKSTVRTIATVLGFAAMSLAGTLALVSPRTTFAEGDDADRMGEYTADGTKFGTVVVNGTVTRDAHSRTGWSMIITANNESDDSANCALETDLTRQMIVPMSRAGAEATTVLKQQETITVAAHQKLTVRHDVPAWIVEQLNNADRITRAKAKAQAEAEKTGNYESSQAVLAAPFPSFSVGFLKAHG